MPTLPSPATIGTFYFGSAAAFGLLYYVRWRVDPDAFIVHQEMNLRPSRSWRRRLHDIWNGKSPSKANAPGESIESLQSRQHDLTATYDRLTEELQQTERDFEAAQALEKELGAKHMKEFAENMRLFTESELERKLAEFAASRADGASLGMSTNVDQQSSLNLHRADYEYEISKAALANTSTFTKTSVLDSLTAAFDRVSQLLDLRIKRVFVNECG